MTHNCDYALDLDGQVTCINCGAMDDDASTPITLDMFESQVDFE